MLNQSISKPYRGGQWMASASTARGVSAWVVPARTMFVLVSALILISIKISSMAAQFGKSRGSVVSFDVHITEMRRERKRMWRLTARIPFGLGAAMTRGRSAREVPKADECDNGRALTSFFITSAVSVLPLFPRFSRGL